MRGTRRRIGRSGSSRLVPDGAERHALTPAHEGASDRILNACSACLQPELLIPIFGSAELLEVPPGEGRGPAPPRTSNWQAPSRTRQRRPGPRPAPLRPPHHRDHRPYPYRPRAARRRHHRPARAPAKTNPAQAITASWPAAPAASTHGSHGAVTLASVGSPGADEDAGPVPVAGLVLGVAGHLPRTAYDPRPGDRRGRKCSEVRGRPGASRRRRS
jgi:hypothetical protein